MDASPWLRSYRRLKVPEGRQNLFRMSLSSLRDFELVFLPLPRTDVRGYCLPSLRDFQERATSKNASEGTGALRSEDGPQYQLVSMLFIAGMHSGSPVRVNCRVKISLPELRRTILYSPGTSLHPVS